MKIFFMLVVFVVAIDVVMSGCCRRAIETKLLKEEQGTVNAKSDCRIVDACMPPGGNDGDRQASCNNKNCFYASEEECDIMCDTVNIPNDELQSSDEVTGWSSKLRINE
jgi:hypothetical protein